jgi:hypothetical protein
VSPDFKSTDGDSVGDGWGRDYERKLSERDSQTRKDGAAEARNQIERKQRDRTYYELPQWEREELERRARE